MTVTLSETQLLFDPHRTTYRKNGAGRTGSTLKKVCDGQALETIPILQSIAKFQNTWPKQRDAGCTLQCTYPPSTRLSTAAQDVRTAFTVLP